EPPRRDALLQGLPGGHPAQAVPGGQFALGWHRRVDGQLVLDQVEQDLPELEVLRDWATRVDGGQGPAPHDAYRVAGLEWRGLDQPSRNGCGIGGSWIPVALLPATGIQDLTRSAEARPDGG